MSAILRLPMNKDGLDFICGDVHGRFTKLKESLVAAGFQKDVDRLILVGDLVDRGAESPEVLDFLDEYKPVSARGNHEAMLLDYCWNKKDVDPQRVDRLGQTWFFKITPDLRSRIVKRFQEFPLMIEVPTPLGAVIVCHAQLSARSWGYCLDVFDRGDPARREYLAREALWGTSRMKTMDDSRVEGCRAVVVGHYGVKEHTILGNHHYIDTGAWLEKSDHPFYFLDASSLRQATKSTQRPIVLADEDIPY